MDHLSGRDSLKEVIRENTPFTVVGDRMFFFLGGGGRWWTFLHGFFFFEKFALAFEPFFFWVVWLLSTSVGDKEKEHSNS